MFCTHTHTVLRQLWPVHKKKDIFVSQKSKQFLTTQFPPFQNPFNNSQHTKMAPPTYGDLGKSSRDVFGKGYHFSLVKLDVKTKTPSGKSINVS